jgi:hypothetical protein
VAGDGREGVRNAGREGGSRIGRTGAPRCRSGARASTHRLGMEYLVRWAASSGWRGVIIADW